MTTNVKPSDLNYDGYENRVYDEDIVRSIPGHEELHKQLETEIRAHLEARGEIKSVLELGVGTGLTSERILQILPEVRLTGVDFSETMINGAKEKLKGFNVDFVTGDYSETKFEGDRDLVISVIGIHHQNNKGKQALFRKIYDALKDGGIFVFGDLVTYKDKKKAALNDALHYHYLVENARNQESLEEWAHHHKYLNDLAPVEDQIEWLRESGFKIVEVKFEHFNTVLIIAQK